MSAEILRLPATGWCVRPGTRFAHYLFLHRGRLVSACGCVERLECYVQQRLRPLQLEKPHCVVCEQKLRKAAAL